MSRMSGSQGGLTRRSFLKTTGVIAGLTGVGAAGMFTANSWLSPAKANAEPEENIVYTYHQAHCGGSCPLKCTVRDGRLVKVEPHDKSEDRYSTICLKGISEIQHIYGPTRIQTPLKRVGERGTNEEFVSITWDEALDIFISTISDLQEKNGKNSVYLKKVTESNFPFLAALIGAQTGGFSGVDQGTGNGLDPAIGFGGGNAFATADPRDWVNANMVLTVGSNFLESSLPQARIFFEAKDAGARMVTVDPHYSTTAGKSDQWVPIVPGTDAAFFLGMITAIIDNGWYDEEFILSHTSLPFLVDANTGALIRDHEPLVDEEKGEAETAADNPYLVWDETKKAPQSYLEKDIDLALEGTFEVNGRKCTTVFSLLKDNQKNHSLEWASEKTGINTDVIEELAREFACDGPASLVLGWGGNDKLSNADIAGHAAAVLVALTGNIAKPGANVGCFTCGSYSAYSASFGSWALPEDIAPAPLEMPAYDMRVKENSVKAYIACGDTIQQSFGNMNTTIKWIESLDFIVMIDVYFNEATKWADLVLPVCTRFEDESPVGNVVGGYNHVVVKNKVIDPLFESVTDFKLQQMVAEKLGHGSVLPANAEEFVMTKLSGSKDPHIAALTIEKINSNYGMYPLNGIEKPRQEFLDKKFNTASTRLDVYYEDMVSFNQALPEYEDPCEAYEGNPLRDSYPLQLSNVRTKFRIHNQFADATWVQQFYEPYIEINPKELSARQLADGDVVEVFNDRGSYKCPVRSNDSVRPGCARMYEGATADFMVEGNMQSVTNDTMIERGYSLMLGPVIPFSDTLIEIKKV